MANAIPVTAAPKGKKPNNESKDISPVQPSESVVQVSAGEPEVSVSPAPVVHPEFGVLHPSGRYYVKHNNE